MLFRHADLIDSDLTLYLVLIASTLGALITGIAFHEACHAFAATSLGDTLPRRQGRVTLNPFAHLDPFGTILMLMIGFGWGKPVQFNPFGLKMSPKNASFFVALAGPMSNFVVAALLAIPIQLDLVPYVNPFRATVSLLDVEGRDQYIGLFLTGAIYLNCILGVFNLIPIPPLDGFKVALGILPDDLAAEFQKLDRYGFGILALLLFGIPLVTLQLTGEAYTPVNDIMVPAVGELVRFLTGENI